MTKPGLWANIHAKRERIAAGSGERMRKPGAPGAPTADAFRSSSSDGRIDRALRAARKGRADGGEVTTADVRRMLSDQVTNRGMILPFADYADGTTRMAVPGVLYEPAAAWRRMMDSRYRPGDDEATRQIAEDSFTAASAAPVAGLAAAAVRPGVSLGSGGGKLGSNPLPIRAYHGTTHEIDGRMRPAPGARGTAVYFNTSPDAASSYATGDAGNYIRFAPTGDHPSVIPADIVGKVFDENAVVSPKERKAIAKARNDAVIADATSKGRKVYPDELMDPTEFAGPYFDRAYPPKGYNVLQALSYEGNEQNAMLRALGYSGRKGPAAGLSGGQDIAMFEPNSVRSALTGDVLYSNSSKASTPGLAALESNRVRGSLPMDEASRMARALELGYDTTKIWHHGSDALPFDRFELGRKGASADVGRPSLSSDTIYFADDPKHAAQFGNNVDSFYVRGKTMDADVSDGFSQWAKELGFDDPQKAIDHYYDGSIYTALNLDDVFADLVRKAKAEGFDNVRATLGGLRGKDVSGAVMIVRDPRNIRSVNAAFDPSKTDSADLLAANPSTASILAFLDKYSEKK